MNVLDTYAFTRPTLPRRVAGAVEKYPTIALFLDRLKELRIFSCAKFHEKPGQSLNNRPCPFAEGNLACGHLMADDAYYLLNAGITFLEYLRLIDSQAAGNYASQLNRSTDALGRLDSLANLYYRGGECSMATVIPDSSEPVSVASIKAAERALGAELLEMRDRLLELLEPFATVVIDASPSLS